MTPVPSFAQERRVRLVRHLLAHGLRPSSKTIPLLVRLPDPVDVDVLREAVGELVARHPVLRHRFACTGDGPAARVTAEPVPVTPPPCEELRPGPDGDTAGDTAGVPARIRAAIDGPFDVSGWPLLRVGVVTGDQPLLYLSMDHLVADAESLTVLRRDLAEIYDAVLCGRAAELPRPPDYFAFAAAERGRLAGQRDARAAALHRTLGGRPAQPLFPLADGSWSPDTGRYVDLHLLDAGGAQRLEQRCRAERATPFVGVLAAFGTALRAACGVDEVGVSIATANRDHAGGPNGVGWYANVLPVYYPAADGFGATLRGARRALMAALEHYDLPIAGVLPAPDAAPPSAPRPVGCFVSFSDARTAAGGTRSADDPGGWEPVPVAPAYGASYAVWTVRADDGLWAKIAAPSPGPAGQILDGFEAAFVAELRAAAAGTVR